MNSLSWLIYLTQIITGVNELLVFFTVLTALATAVISMIALIMFITYVHEHKTPDHKYYLVPRNWALGIGALCLLFNVLQIVVPSKQTFVLIAASEVGERIVNNVEVRKTLTKATNDIVDPSVELLTTWIKTELLEQKKKFKKATKENTEE